MTEHPNLTDERRARIVKRCEEQLSSMLAEVEGWYPDKVVTSAQLKKEHLGLFTRVSSLAKDMGYGSSAELLRNEGFSIELEGRAATNPVGHRIAPDDAVNHIVLSVTGKLDSYFKKIDEWYPDGVVVNFIKLHRSARNHLALHAQELGYDSWADLLKDYGYEVPDYGGPAGGRRATDPAEIVATFDELERRYEEREPVASISVLKEENPDLAVKFGVMQSHSEELFDMSFVEVLVKRGVVQRRAIVRIAPPSADGRWADTRPVPVISDDRRARIIEHCSEQLVSMLAEAEEWYPDKRVSAAQLRSEHDNYRKRLASLAKDMGYGSCVDLLRCEGFEISGKDTGGVRIAPEDAVESIVANVTARLGSYFEKIDEWYPDRVVTGFAKLHNKTKENLSRQARMLGYESWAELLRDYGYEVTDYSSKGGAPKTVDPVAIVDELARRYEGREPAPDMKTLRAENQDLASKLSNIANQSKKVFGKTFGEVLAERGIIQGKGIRGRSVSISVEGAEDAMLRLSELVSVDVQKPSTIAELKKRVESEDVSLSEVLESMPSWSKGLYGETPAQLLKSRGILAGGAGARSSSPAISDDEVEQIINTLRKRYAHTVRPRTIGEFADANPEWRANSKAIKQYLGKRSLGTPAQFLASEELISKIVREDSIARPNDEALDAFLAGVSASAVDLQQGAPGSIITEFDSRVIGDERFGTPPSYEMLRVGDFVELIVSEDAYVHVEFCGHDLGLIGMDERVEYRLVSRVRHAREWGIVGGRVYARVTEITGGQKKPRANLHVFFVEDKSAISETDGLLMSLDGRAVLDCIDKKSGRIAIPKGVTTIAPDAFADQAICAISLPSTLKEIGTRAFYRTDLQEVTIPCGVRSIGVRAFTHGVSVPSYSDSGESYRYDDGPVKIDVERGCERYESESGSLIEVDGDERRLLSLYYRHPSGYSATLAVPRGVTVLGPSCIEKYYSGVLDARLKVPEGVTRMEAGCLEGIRIGRATLPVSLVDIDPHVWLELCGQDIDPYGSDVTDVPEGPLALDSPTRLRIAKGNPRYLVRDRRAYALPAERLPDGSIRVLASAEEVSEDNETSDSFDKVCFQYEEKDGSGFSYSFNFSQDLDYDLATTAEYLEWL